MLNIIILFIINNNYKSCFDEDAIIREFHSSIQLIREINFEFKETIK